jgi:WD40 repeat protein/uncharacterized caspase-like protein
MLDTQLNVRTSGVVRSLVLSLAFTLAAPPWAFGQQPQQPQIPQPRILVPEELKTGAVKPQGPRAARPDLVLQTGVTTPAFNATFSPDGRLLASMDLMAGSIKLWEVASGRELCAINLGARAGFTYAINSDFAFSADGSSLFSASAGTLKQWDTRSGRQARATDLNQGKDFGQAIFSADARLLTTITDSHNSLAVWDVTSGRKLQELNFNIQEGERVLACALSPDGRTLATDVETDRRGERLDELTLRDVASGRVVQTVKLLEQNKRMAATIGATQAPWRAIRFSPDGRTVAIAFKDTTTDVSQIFSTGQTHTGNRTNKIRMWEASSGRELISIDAGDQRAWDLEIAIPNGFAFSNNIRQAALTNGNAVKIFDPVAGRDLATVSGHTREVISVSFSADGKYLATTSVDNTIKIWDVSAAILGRVELARTLGGIAMPAENAAFSSDGRSLTIGGAQAVNMWELSAGSALRTITLPAIARSLDEMRNPSNSVISAGGQLVAAQSGPDEVKLWETRTGREVKSFPISQGKRLVGGGVSPDGAWVALSEGQGDSKSSAMSSNSAANPASLVANQPSAQQIGAPQPGSPQTAPPQPIAGFPQLPPTTSPPPASTGDPKKDAKARQKDAKEQVKEMQKQQRELLEQMMRGAKKNQKGQPQMQVGGMDMAQMQKVAEQMQKAADSGDMGKVLEAVSQMSGAYPGIPGMGAMSQPAVNVKLWGVGPTSEPRALPGASRLSFEGPSSVFAFNNDSSLMAYTSEVRSIKIHEMASGRTRLTLAPERGMKVDALSWSPDGRTIASSVVEFRGSVDTNDVATLASYSGLYKYSIRLWDAASGRELQALAGHTANIRAMAFSPDGKLLASGGDDAAIKLWETATGRELMTLGGHSLAVRTLAFSPDGKLLVSGGDDGSAKLWDASRGEALATLVSTNGGADWLVVTPDGLFDGTPGAWGQILWRFSPNNIFDAAPVEIFFNEFFYPGLLSDIVAGKHPRAAQDVAQKDRRQPVVNLVRADGQGAAGRTIKLKLEISEPAAANAGANSAPPTGARDVRLFRNGTLVKVWRGDALRGQKRAALEAEIPVVAGENRLLAYAFNRDGVKSPDATMTVMGDASLRRKGVAYVIACGVNQYANAQYNLKYAVADASSFAEEVAAQQVKLQEYGRVEVIPLLDKDATKANILLALSRLSNAQPALPPGAPQGLSKIQPAQPEDAVLLFFAGHGAAQGARFYLIPHDLGYTGARTALTADAVRTILSHGVSDLELEAALEGVDAGQLLFVLDACNSGQALEAEEKRRGPMNSSGLAQLAYEKGMYILTAAQSYQAALEAAELGHGYLTFALIEDGLKKGLADRDPKDGRELAREWFNYATDRVPQMQERVMQTRLLLDFSENDPKSKDPKQRNIQRPRVFYRRELEARPFVVAKP